MSSYSLVITAIVACVAVWYAFNFRPITLNNTLKFQRLFTSTKAPPPQFTFYKLSLQWPPSSCNSGQMTCKPPTGPTPSVFTIHGIWPQYANDSAVPPYNPTTNPCVNVTPTPSTQLPTLLQPIRGNLISLWPDLKDPQNSTVDMVFWTKEWERHGMCSDYPTNPRDYFSFGLQLRNGLDPVMGLAPGSTDTLQNFAVKVQYKVNAAPEIACNKKKGTNTIQIWEIRLCYNRSTHAIQNCPTPYSGACKNISPTTSISFPK